MECPVGGWTDGVGSQIPSAFLGRGREVQGVRGYDLRHCRRQVTVNGTTATKVLGDELEQLGKVVWVPRLVACACTQEFRLASPDEKEVNDHRFLFTEP